MKSRVPDPVRQTALWILLQHERMRRSIDAPLRTAANSFEERDRRFLWTLVQESVRWRSRLDAVVRPLVNRPLEQLDPAVRILLRLSACQICCLDQIPDHAITDEAVRLAKRTASPGADRLVNAVCRRLTADGRARWDHLGNKQSPADWPVSESHPSWLVQRWRRRLGDETTLAILRWDNTHAPVWLRARADGPSPSGEPGWVPNTYRMPQGYRPSEDPLFEKGAWTAQDPSEALVGLLAPDNDSGTILDLCASPGTKASHLGERFPGRVIAADRTRVRVQRLRETLERTGSSAHLLLADATRAPLRPASAAGALVDAPCSNLGVLRRRVDARWNVREPEIVRHGNAQLKLLTAASKLVQPGGWLLYSVCSTEPEETDRVRAAFLAAATSYRPGALPAGLPPGILDEDGSVRILPGHRDCDGVYAALFHRVEGGE
jgi:16S rRNA (cytosine967-C5)-methyltransferase